MPGFDHERLDVYQAAVKFIAHAYMMIDTLPSGNAHLVNQLQRAAVSISLNIAEGSGEFSKPDKVRFFRMARRSATECSAVLDVLRVLKLAEDTDVAAGRELLDRIVAMLTRMIWPGKRPQSHAQAQAQAE